jgi:probable F420-dependent oxidoreductase
MRIGFCVPQFGPAPIAPNAITRFALGAETLGADSLWVGDRLLAPVDPVVGYAGTDSMPEQFRSSMDPFAVLTASAAVTERVLLGTSVLNAPFYSPVPLARALTSIDVISGGRLVPGFGTGWSPDEFGAVGIPMAERGGRLDETLDILDTLWTRNPAEHHGKRWDIPPTHNELRPARRPPVYLGGRAPGALSRVARRADGWLPTAVVPRPFDPDAISQPLTQIRDEAERAGRDPESIGVILRVNPGVSATLADIVAVIKASEDIGIDHAYVELMYLTDSADAALDLAAQIITKVRQS